MKKILSTLITALMLTSLSACMILPLDDRPYYGGHSDHHRHQRDNQDYERYR